MRTGKYRFYRNGRYGWCRAPVSGIWWVRSRRWLLVLKAPWNSALFSERYAYYVFRLPLGGGWRFIVKRDHPSWMNFHRGALR